MIQVFLNRPGSRTLPRRRLTVGATRVVYVPQWFELTRVARIVTVRSQRRSTDEVAEFTRAVAWIPWTGTGPRDLRTSRVGRGRQRGGRVHLHFSPSEADADSVDVLLKLNILKTRVCEEVAFSENGCEK